MPTSNRQHNKPTISDHTSTVYYYKQGSKRMQSGHPKHQEQVRFPAGH